MNSYSSQSGYNSLRNHLLDKEFINSKQPAFFSSSTLSGSHRQSIKHVAIGKADICAIDPVSWALSQRFDVEARELKILTQTDYSPGLPIITTPSSISKEFTEVEWQKLFLKAFTEAIDNVIQKELRISDITLIPKSEYLKLKICDFHISQKIN